MATSQTGKKFDVVVELKDLKRFEDEAFESLRRDLTLPGFRKGTVTVNVARQHIAPEAIFREAIERAVSTKGARAIKGVLDRIVGQTDVQIVKAVPGNPLEFSVTVELLPHLDVSRWRQLRIPLKPRNVAEEDIGKVLEGLKQRRVKTQAVNRPAKVGDLVEVDFVTRIDGVKAQGGESKNHPLVLGEGKFVPGFEDAIVGMERGEKKQLSLPFPKDWPVKQFAGKEGEFSVTLNNILERILPKIDDAFAKTLGDFADLSALKKSIREGLKIEKVAEEKQRVRQEAVKQLGKPIRGDEIPQTVISQELDRMRDELSARIESYGGTLQQYLSDLGKKEDELEKDWQEAALDRIRATLVVRAVARVEDITPDAETVESRLREMLNHQRSVSGAEKQLDPDQVRSYTETVLINEMTLDLIETVVVGRGKETSE